MRITHSQDPQALNGGGGATSDPQASHCIFVPFRYVCLYCIRGVNGMRQQRWGLYEEYSRA